MRVLITHHGVDPRTATGPISGGALRAGHHARVLENEGHDVILMTRRQDDPAGFAGPAELVARARSLRPDRVICVQPEEAPALAQLEVPLAVDLYAPRILEAAFSPHLPQTAALVMAALSAGDVFFVSNARQQWSFRGLMALAGRDPATDCTRLVPLAAPAFSAWQPPPAEPCFVVGGARWPWHDPLPSLARILAHLDARGTGRVVWSGGAPLLGEGGTAQPLPEHPRLTLAGWRPYSELLRHYAGATAALDWLGAHPERQLALSFRHADYLGAGLPILTGADSALVDRLFGAGIATDHIEAALDQVLDDPNALQALREHAQAAAVGPWSAMVTGQAVVDWVASGTVHRRVAGPFAEPSRWLQERDAARLEAARLEEALTRVEAEVEAKRAEVARLHNHNDVLTETLARQARALDEVAGFKREAVSLLGGRSERAERQSHDLARENGLLRADIEKKSAELKAMDDLRARLENDLDNLRAELERLRAPRGLLGRRR